ncbi:hypothetical protein GCM10028803_46380 [Larkinella knui]|uniref:Uncharacterized protein n=1 Tax=Larkinella knui TaxID=2025310 RepID=A0A3P1CPI8_9BACT|nr:hypothetical protein [Larkinella knui]RRB15231.1 hypothetical protein EHT87_11865 [Larkinella knui]
MIIKASNFQALDTRQMQRFNIKGLKVELIKELIRQQSTYLYLDQKPILPNLDGEQRQGIEVGISFVALHRRDYKQVLTLLLDLAGGDTENENYKQIRAIMERS